MSLRFGPFALDPQSGELRRDGTMVPLAPQPFRLLAALAGRPGQLMTREELRQVVWGDDTFVDFERGLNFCVLQVRTALGDDAKNPAWIETLPRRGYRFIGTIAPEETASTEESSPSPATPRRPRWWIAAAAALAGLAALAAWQRPEQGALRAAVPDRLGARSTEAHEAYLRGRQLWAGRKNAQVEESVRELRNAIRIEPEFVLAHVALAESLHVLAMRERIDPRAAREEIAKSSEAALRLAPSSAQSHNITAMLRFWYDWDWAAAEESYRRTMQLNPNEPGALHDHGWLLLTRGDQEGGLAEIRRAQELDPLSPRANMHVAWAYVFTRRYDDAIRESKRALELSPGLEEAERCISDAEQLERGEGRAAGTPNARDPYGTAVRFALAGDRESALEWLLKAKEQRNLSFPLAGLDPKLDLLNGDPRFEELLKSVGLSRQSRSGTPSPSRASRRS